MAGLLILAAILGIIAALFGGLKAGLLAVAIFLLSAFGAIGLARLLSR